MLATEVEMFRGASPRVIPFPELRDVGGLLQRAGFALPVVDAKARWPLRLAVSRCMQRPARHGYGQSARRPSQPPLVGRFPARAELYAERFADADGRIRATFSIIYASGWKPHESQQKPPRPGSASTRLADALKVEEQALKP